ncbi:ABC transporter permease [Streptomyces sp. 4N509B]|uniref:ABC transporter permease n=1 Tax=Streptomyces sp. 4N509B TaxID=3457413 RepID=UPI003FD68CAC
MTTPPMSSPVPPQAPPVGQVAPGGPAGQPLHQGPAGPPGPAGPAAGPVYASPMPVRRSHLGHALASEWTKIRTVRSTVWTLVIMFVLVVGLGAVIGTVLSGEDELNAPLLGGGFFGLMLGQLCIITLGVLVVSSEYGTGMIRTTFTACPQRGRVLLAKAVVFFLLAFVMTLAATGLTGLILESMLSGMPVDPYADPDVMKDSVDPQTGEVIVPGSHWLGATVGAALYVSLLGLLGLAVGALLRHSAGAITAMIGVVVVPLLMALFMVGDGLAELREKLIEYSPLNGLASLYRIPMQGEDDATGWPLLGLLAAVTLAVLIGAFARVNATDA